MMDYKYKLGIVEEQLDWIDTFKRKLKVDFEVYVFELNNLTETKDIIEKIESEKIDCIIADYELNETEVVGFNGDKLIEDIKLVYPLFPVFIITGKDEDFVLSQVDEDDSDIVRDKDEVTDKTQSLITRIKNKINSYKSKINEAENTIQNLIEKKNSDTGISILEEELLTEKYLFLEKINPADKSLPDNLIQPESITKLNEFVADTKQILEALKNIKK